MNGCNAKAALQRSLDRPKSAWGRKQTCEPVRLPERKNHVWSYDLVHHRTDDGRAFRTLDILDEFRRECLDGNATLDPCSFAECDTGTTDKPARSLFRVIGSLFKSNNSLLAMNSFAVNQSTGNSPVTHGYQVINFGPNQSK
jgi:hypothetical protein